MSYQPKKKHIDRAAELLRPCAQYLDENADSDDYCLAEDCTMAATDLDGVLTGDDQD